MIAPWSTWLPVWTQSLPHNHWRARHSPVLPLQNPMSASPYEPSCRGIEAPLKSGAKNTPAMDEGQHGIADVREFRHNAFVRGTSGS